MFARLKFLWVMTIVCPMGIPGALVGQEGPPQSTHPPLTAERYLERWENPRDLPPEGQLSAEEADKVVQVLRQRFPFESLRPRLQYERPTRLQQHSSMHRMAVEPSSGETDLTLDRYAFRARALEQLHSEKAIEFIQRDGFGVERIRRESPYDLRRFDLGEIALQTEYVPPTRSTAEGSLVLGHSPGAPSESDIESVHQQAATLFASAEANGLVRDLDQVAGFEAHRLAQLPMAGGIGQPAEQPAKQPAKQAESIVWWKINRLELVGLLKHEHYIVYSSNYLPDMDNLATVPTRKLDEFEVESLGQLFSGEDLVIRAQADRIRMLGALRAGDQCLECHAVQKGELLGAFSYELLRKLASEER